MPHKKHITSWSIKVPFIWPQRSLQYITVQPSSSKNFTELAEFQHEAEVHNLNRQEPYPTKKNNKIIEYLKVKKKMALLKWLVHYTTYAVVEGHRMLWQYTVPTISEGIPKTPVFVQKISYTTNCSNNLKITKNRRVLSGNSEKNASINLNFLHTKNRAFV